MMSRSSIDPSPTKNNVDHHGTTLQLLLQLCWRAEPGNEWPMLKLRHVIVEREPEDLSTTLHRDFHEKRHVES